MRVHVEQAEKGQNSRCQCGVPYQWYGVPLYGKICCLLWEFPSKLVEEIESKKNNYWWSIAIEVLTRRWRLGPSWSGRRPPRWSRCAPWPWPPWTWAQGVELKWIELTNSFPKSGLFLDHIKLNSIEKIIWILQWHSFEWHRKGNQFGKTVNLVTVMKGCTLLSWSPDGVDVTSNPSPLHPPPSPLWTRRQSSLHAKQITLSPGTIWIERPCAEFGEYAKRLN